MTEREYYREREGAETGATREIYQETLRDGAPVEASRDVSQVKVYESGGDRVVQRERVHVPGERVQRDRAARRIQQVIAFIVGVVVTLIAIRFVLLLLGAGQGSGFVQLIYGLTQPFVTPFLGIFGEPTVGASVVEWASVVAMVIYGLVGYGLNRLVDVAYRPTSAARI